MTDFATKNKVFIVLTVGTIILLLGGVFLFSGKSATNNSTNKIAASLLIPQSATKTSGFANGNYLPVSPSATTTLVEFGDYECPACATYDPMVKQLLTEYSGKLTFVFRNYPLPQHTNAPISSYAVEAAGLQGKYWQMHDKIYETQNDWANLSDAKSVFVGFAQGFNLNVDQFTKDLASLIIKNIVQNDLNDGNTIGITETPTFYLNGQKITLTGSYEQLKSLVAAAVANQ